MSTDPDEDLIEATIRRIQAQNAEPGDPASGTGVGDPGIPEDDPIEATIRRVQQQADSGTPAAPGVEDTPEGEYASASMDRIESMLKRVKSQAAEHRAAEQLAGTSADAAPTHADSFPEDPIEATIRRVQAQAAAQANTASTESDGDPAPTSADEDAIAETIRRVQMQAAAQEEEPTPEHLVTDAPQDEDPIAATIRRVAEAKARREATEFDGHDAPTAPHSLPRAKPIDEATLAVETNGTSQDDAFAPAAEVRPRNQERAITPEPTPWPGRDERMLGEPATWEIAAQRLEQGLQDTQREVRQMAARLDALLPAIERLAQSGASQQSTPLKIVGQQGQPSRDNDDWDDSPKVASMQFGAPPRPAIFRDPSPQTATAAEFVEEPAPVPELTAAAAPRLRAIDADGNLGSHLPRQYRITVEDKRRGVDLVPLHRAIQGVTNVKDMSLLSYSNGVAIVAIESLGALDPECLREAVERAMSRETKIEVHNEQTMVVKIQEE